jgi:hypothetical protein
MKGDFSRLTFNPAKAFTQVLRQQGRVDLDADWNEQQAILNYLDRTTRTDIIGPAGAPIDNAGFAVTLPGGNLHIGAGHFYVQGQFVDLAEDTDFGDQPYSAGLPLFLDSDGNPVDSPPAGRYLFYLETWDYHVTAVEDPDLREPALGAGGPDTTTRVKTVWRVRALRVDDAGGAAHCETVTPAWTALVTPPDGMLAAQARNVPPSTNLCALPESAGYQSLDHRHYFVEIHDPSSPGPATWKWSRDNAAFVARWLARNGNELTVSTTGFDAHIGFRNGGWVELTSDTRELAGLPGTLVRVDRVAGDILEVDTTTATGSLNPADFGNNPKIRAWDSAGAVDLTTGSFLPLENGVEVEFSPGDYRTGDYWMIPARSGVGVLWPREADVAVPFGRFGTDHRFARLALLDFDSSAWTFVADCRSLFPAATDLMTLDVTGGDAQEIPPDPMDTTALLPLRLPLQVGVARGIHPVENALVRFRVTTGNGRLTGNVTDLTVVTDADGRAQVAFSLDSTTLDQSVEARLVSPGGDPHHLTHTFSARLSRASEVSFDPANCPPLGGTRDVQSAIEALCQMGQSGCATYVVIPGSDWVGLLSNLQPGEDAHVCFKRGTFTARGPVVLENLGHITLSGCGEGTRIVVNNSERAIEAIDCQSFTLRDVAVSTPDGGNAVSHIGHLNGSITATGCANVEITGAVISCGASARLERSCLNIRPNLPDDDSATSPLTSVKVTNNRLTAGYGQIGLLVTDALRTQIRDNDISVAPRPATLTFERLVAEPVRRKRLANRIVSEALIEGRGDKGNARELRAGGFTALIHSSVPDDEWRKLMAETPPTDAQKGSADAYRAYVEGLVDAASQDPKRLPSYDRQLSDLAFSLGDAEFGRLNQTVKTGLLVSRPVEVKSFEEMSAARRTNAMIVDDKRIQFDSPVSDADWNNILRAQPPGDLRGDADLLRYAKDSAYRLVVDEPFRRRFPSAANWFDSLKANNPSVGHQGIVCGGRWTRDADISGNRVHGYMIGIHVGLSHRGATSEQFDQATNVRVKDNDLLLRLPIERSRGLYGLFVGNVRRLELSGNTLERATPRTSENRYSEGVRVWGHLGTFVVLRENVVSVASIGLRVRDTGVPPETGQVQWLAADNMAEGASLVVDAPKAMVRRNNKPS